LRQTLRRPCLCRARKHRLLPPAAFSLAYGSRLVVTAKKRREHCLLTIESGTFAPFDRMVVSDAWRTMATMSGPSTLFGGAAANAADRISGRRCPGDRQRLDAVDERRQQRAGSSVATMSGTWRCNSSNMTLISRRARLAPKQKWAPPPPKPTCGFRLRARSKVHGLANFDSSRLTEQYHSVTLSPGPFANCF
jgi:hypothetical protein